MKTIKFQNLLLAIGLLCTMSILILSCSKDDDGKGGDSNSIIAAFDIPTGDIFANSAISFVNTSTNATSYSWDLGDGNTSTVVSPTHTYGNAGSYAVKLTASNADGDSKDISKTIIVKEIPLTLTSLFNISAGPYANKKDIILTNNSIKATTYLWDFGNGTSSTEVSPTIQYQSEGTYLIKLTAFDDNGQSAESSKPITIAKNADLLVVDFTTPSGDLYYQKSISFTNKSSGASSYSWNFGDGKTSTAKNPNHTYTSAGTFNVNLTVSDGVNNKSKSKSIVVKVKRITKSFLLRGVTTWDHNHKMFGDIEIRILNPSGGDVIAPHLFWNNQGNAINTGIDGTSTSYDNISSNLNVSGLDEYLVGQGYYTVELKANLGVWHQDNIFAQWGRITNYSNTKVSFTTDGDDIWNSTTITTNSDSNRIHNFKIYARVK